MPILTKEMKRSESLVQNVDQRLENDLKVGWVSN